jgi:putative NADH-flavin reductase
VSSDVIVLGATGRVGALTVDLALADGFTVTAVARTPAKVRRTHEKLIVVQGDTTDLASLRQALARVGSGDGQAPSVVMAVGADPLKPSTLVGDTVANLVTVMPEVGLHRYVGVSGVAQMPSTPIGRLTQTVLRRAIKAAVDHQRAFDLLVGSHLDWVVAGCPYIKDGHPPGRALERESPFPGGYRVISPWDVAAFLVRHLQDLNHHRQIIGLW